MPGEGRDRTAFWTTVGLSAALLVGLYAPVFVYFVPRWFEESPYYHCPIVPLIVAWLIWRRRKELAAARFRPSAAGLGLLALGLLVYVVGARTGARLVVGVSLPIVLLGLCGALMGGKILRRLAVPLALSFFLVPVPRHVLGYVAFPMQIVSAHSAAVVGRATGIPVHAQGVDMHLGDITFTVAQECSGLNSLLALLLATGVMVEIMEMRLFGKLVVMALAPAVVLVANVVRLVSVLWFARFLGADFALNSLVHGTSDLIVYSAAVVLVLFLIDIVRRLTEGKLRLAWPGGLLHRRSEEA